LEVATVVLRISRQHRVYSFSPKHTPAARVAPDSTVILETGDCYDGQVPLDAQTPSDRAIDRTRTNPATGPIYIDGAKPGDTLVVSITRVETVERGIVMGSDASGGMREPFVLTVAGGYAELPGGLQRPVNPVVGVIGVAPPEETIRTSHPGDHGGNLDTTDVRAGATVYLPIAVEGALFALGDVHALQGDGEVCGQGLEIAGEVSVTLSLRPGTLADGPVIRTGDAWSVLAAGEDLDAAADLAVQRARRFLVDHGGYSETQAIALLSLCCDLRVNQIVNPLRGARVRIPRWLLPRLGG
jgi:amidase